MVKKIHHIVLIAALLLLPLVTLAQGPGTGEGGNPPSGSLIVCNTDYNSSTREFNDPCDFPALIRLAGNIIDFLIILSIPLAAISFAWAGALMVSGGGNEGQITKAKGIFTKTLIGFIFVLSAWLIVNTLLTALVDDTQDNIILLEESS